MGDPDTSDPTTGERAPDLDAARLEAYAIRQSFYRGARYVGRRPDGSTSPSGDGTRDQVSDWLTASGPASGACPAVLIAQKTRAASGLGETQGY